MGFARHNWTRNPGAARLGFGTHETRNTDNSQINTTGAFIQLTPPWDFDKITVYVYIDAILGSGAGANLKFELFANHATSDAVGTSIASTTIAMPSAAGWASASLTFTSQADADAYWVHVFKDAGSDDGFRYPRFVGNNALHPIPLGGVYPAYNAIGSEIYMGTFHPSGGGGTRYEGGPHVVKIEDTSNSRSAILGCPWPRGQFDVVNGPQFYGVEVQFDFDCIVGPFAFDGWNSTAWDKLYITDTSGNTLYSETIASPTRGVTLDRACMFVEGYHGDNNAVKLDRDTAYRIVAGRPSGLALAQWVDTGAGTVPADVTSCIPGWFKGTVRGTALGSLTLRAEEALAMSFGIEDISGLPNSVRIG